MNAIGIVGNHTKPQFFEVVDRIAAFCSRHGAGSLWVEPHTREKVRAPVAQAPLAEFLPRADTVFVLGGDGTVLSYAREMARHGAHPLLVCVNLGSVGFLAENRVEDLDETLARTARGDYDVREHFLLAVRSPETAAPAYALNEVVFTGKTLSRLFDIDLTIDDQPVTTFRCDGLIVSSPTGSTAHSLSAGGPIIMPGTPALLITPICPFTLANRPLIVPAGSRLRIHSSRAIGMTLDGQEYAEVPAGDPVDLQAAPGRVRMAHARTQSFFDLLKKKFNWKGGLSAEPRPACGAPEGSGSPPAE